MATSLPEIATTISGAAIGNTRLVVGNLFGGVALQIFAAGWVLAQTGDALAEQSGLGDSFVGVALVAASTSLPELSKTLEAVRRGRHEMAVSGILDTNCPEVALLSVADVTYREGPILATVPLVT